MTSAENPHQKFKGDDAAMMRWLMGELCTEEGAVSYTHLTLPTKA